MEIPKIGLGTWNVRGKECEKAVKEALGLGYRHIDTAHVYQNHEAIRRGMEGFSRSDIFLTSKIALEQVDLRHVADSVEMACDLALSELGTDYLDLYLIHWPDRNYPLSEIYSVMEKLKEKGKIDKAGVSNFTIHHLQDLMDNGCKPSFNQVEFHPFLYQRELLAFCEQNEIELISYRSLGKGALLKETIFHEIGNKYHKTAAQVILRWLYEKKIIVIPKSIEEKHLKENLEIFDFVLQEEDVYLLDHLDQKKRFCMADHKEFTY